MKTHYPAGKRVTACVLDVVTLYSIVYTHRRPDPITAPDGPDRAARLHAEYVDHNQYTYPYQYGCNPPPGS